MMGIPIDGAYPVAERLRAPARSISLDALPREWFCQVIEVRLAGYARVLHDHQLLRRVRGAFGDRLRHGASDLALERAPCRWDPPCALDIFFREQFRHGRHGVPKPFVLSADRVREDLLVRLSVFGFACDWIHAAHAALIETLRSGVDWAVLSNGKFLPRIRLDDVRILTANGLDFPPAPSGIGLEFLTPLDAAGEGDLVDDAANIIARLARRVDLLSRWQDVSLAVDWGEMKQHWSMLSYEPELRPDQTTRGSRRQGRQISRPAVNGSLAIFGDLEPIWPLLLIGETCHIGKGSVEGLGRYRLIPA